MSEGAAQTGADAIRHVVVLMLENHSFDQMPGCFTEVYPDLDGIDPAARRENRDSEGRSYPQAETIERIMFLDPHHEVEHVKFSSRITTAASSKILKAPSAAAVQRHAAM
jgi:phospholipase C